MKPQKKKKNWKTEIWWFQNSNKKARRTFKIEVSWIFDGNFGSFKLHSTCIPYFFNQQLLFSPPPPIHPLSLLLGFLNFLLLYLRWLWVLLNLNTVLFHYFNLKPCIKYKTFFIHSFLIYYFLYTEVTQSSDFDITCNITSGYFFMTRIFQSQKYFLVNIMDRLNWEIADKKRNLRSRERVCRVSLVKIWFQMGTQIVCVEGLWPPTY